MNLKEFIRDKYPIKDKIESIFTDPIKQIMEQDDLPYDGVMSIDGTMQKVVYVSDDTYIPVVEILSYYAEEVQKMKDEEFKTVYFAYMDNIDLSDLTIETIMSSAREYNEGKLKRDELLAKCIQ